MSSHIVSLAWDGHHRTIVRVFEKLLVNSHFVDCTIAAEGQKLKAHREILSAFSPFFELLFSEETENNPTLIISGISFRDLRSLVDFMYQGKLEIPEDRVQDVIDAAECLQIEGLGDGHKEDDSGNIKNTTVLLTKPAFSSCVRNKRTGKGESEESASTNSKKSQDNSLNYSNEVQLKNSVVIVCRARQSSVQNLISNSDVQNVGIISNESLMPAQSTQSEIEMDGSNLQICNRSEMEPRSDEDENISEPMSDTSSIMHVFGNSENSYENSDEETIDVLSADINVPSEKSVNELPMDYVSPTVLGSQLCHRDLTVSSVKNVLSNINVKSSSESVELVGTDEETQDPLFQSELDMKIEDETLLSVDNDLICENDELSENLPESIRIGAVSDMQKKVVCTEKNNFSGASSRCISESTYSPQELPAAFVKIQRRGRNEPGMGLIPGLLAGVNPHVTPILPSHTTAVCDRDLPGATGRDISNGSSLADTLYFCQICNRTFTHSRSIHAHMRIHSKDRLFRYGECNNAEVASIKLSEHRYNQSGRKLYKCTVCEFKSVDRSALSVHMNIHKGLELYRCTECEYTSTYSWLLKVHQRSHSRLKPYKCTECDHRATKLCNLKTHLLIHSGMKPYKCTECDYTTALNANLKTHQRIHSGDRPYKCMECDYSATQISSLKTHQLLHSGVKPFKCTECGYRTALLGNLKTHQRIHSGIKPYKCTECDYRTAQIGNLKTHQRIHSGIKPYKCTECEYTSAYRQNLKMHQRTHRLKTYKCVECDYSAVQLIDLKKHQQIHSGVNL